MESMNISLPESLKTFVDQQIESGHYSSVSEYVRELIREDEKRKTQVKLEGLLMDGLTGPAREMTAKHWDALKKTIDEKLSKCRAK